MPPDGERVGRTCPYCGSVVTSEDFFCRACHKRFELMGAETDPTKTIGLREGSVLDLKSPVLSGFLSCAGMGMGQFYNGDTVKGLLFNAVYLPLVLGYLAIPYTHWLLAGIWAVSLVDAPVAAWRINHLATDFSGTSLLFYVELLILSGLLVWFLFSGDAFVWVKKLFPAVYFWMG